MRYRVEVLITKEELQNRINQLGNDITGYFKEKNEDLLVVGLLRGSVIFVADLIRQIDVQVNIDFMTVANYGESMKNSGIFKILKDLEENVSGKNVLVVEDIISTGITIDMVTNILKKRGAKTVKVCSLLNRPEKREKSIDVDFLGFDIGNEFVVGYGMDYHQKHRNLEYVGKIVKIED